MREISTTLKMHTPWYRYSFIRYTEDQYELFETEQHFFKVGDICDVVIANNAEITITFKNEVPESEGRECCFIILYFISLCNGYNCEFERQAIIDGKVCPFFFSFAQQDNTDLPLAKDLKYHEISLKDIDHSFGEILYKLINNPNRSLILSLLSNYYFMVFYKDFIGNSIHKFRGIVANLESIISIINTAEYAEEVSRNIEFFNKLCENTSFSKTVLKSHLSPRRITLAKKLTDVFRYVEKFGLFFKLVTTDESKKIADTRNFVSHLFDSSKHYLTDEEISDYNCVLEEIFRMIFLEYCGIDCILIKNNFLKSHLVRMRLKKHFSFETIQDKP